MLVLDFIQLLGWPQTLVIATRNLLILTTLRENSLLEILSFAICMQHVYTVLIYMFIHTYQSNVVAPYVQLSLQLHTTNQNITHV